MGSYTTVSADGKNKHCNTCKLTLPIENFNKRTANSPYFQSECKSCHAKRETQLRVQLKVQVLTLLGSKCNWPDCTWTDSRALCIDHINADGNLERAKIGQGPTAYFLRMVLKNPERYQLLCGSHHMIKTATIDPALKQERGKR